MLAACGGKEEKEDVENGGSGVDTIPAIQWQVQNVSKYPLIKSVTQCYDATSRNVTLYQYDDDFKISSERRKREEYNNISGLWQWMSVADTTISFTYSNDTIVSVAGLSSYSKAAIYKNYYYLNNDGFAERCEMIPNKQYYIDSSIADFYFEYDSVSHRNTTLFHWENGNAVSGTDVGKQYGCYFDSARYDANRINNYYFHDNKIFLGRASENLLLKENMAAYTYEYDKGVVTKATILHENGSTAVKYYEYY